MIKLTIFLNNYFYLLFFLFLNLFFLPVKSDPIFEMGKNYFFRTR